MTVHAPGEKKKKRKVRKPKPKVNFFGRRIMKTKDDLIRMGFRVE